MEKTYQPQDIEKRRYELWEDAKYFQHRPEEQGQNTFCIMLPPPNVTGTLHMGHGFQVTLMDTMIRYHRMLGDNTLWQGGTDHAGIATQMVVEKQLAKEKTSRHELGREAFVERVWEWREQSGNTITQQLKRMGASIEWEREKFTMDPDIAESVKNVFIQLYEEGLIYRGKRLVNWDPVFHTAISDLEVESTEEKGHLWYIRYPIVNSDESLVVATTRPETILGDTAVAVHPQDERYQHLIGKYIALPLSSRQIPIVADHEVITDFGSGCVKITPAHDFTDYQIGLRHDLPLINILNPDATLNENSPATYQGMDRFDARKKIVEDLQALNLLEKIEDYTLKTPRGDRSGAVIEPYLTDQWFVKTKPLAEPAIEAVKRGDIEFVPGNWSKIYFQWLENIQDWCISRQLWWGHRIPAWYDENNRIYVGDSEASIREKYQLDAQVVLTQDEDVLDTWFSSALWPFVTLDWPKKTPELELFYPTSILVTGWDIIFFWVARMVMMGLKFMDKPPFEKVYITGLIRDADGQKMSKSKGNTLDPIDLIDGIDLESLIKKRTRNMLQPKLAKKIEKATRKEFPEGIPAYGTDALRFTFCALASHGRDIRFDLGRIDGYRNFTNKIWNAARYVLMNTEQHAIPATVDPSSLSLYDQWIMTALSQAISSVHQSFSDYRFDRIATTIYEFIWDEYCDWYLEFSKSQLMDESVSEAEKAATRHTLVNVLETFLRLLHPLMPYITAEIWQKVKLLIHKTDETIMLTAYPQASDLPTNESAISEVTQLKLIITAIRNIRGEMNISPAQKIPLIVNKGKPEDKVLINQQLATLSNLAKLSSIEWLDDRTAPQSATAICGELEILIPLAGIIDTDAEIKRLGKEIEKLKLEIKKCEGKLNNPGFVNKAPESVVVQEQDRLADFRATLDALQEKSLSIQKIEKT